MSTPVSPDPKRILIVDDDPDVHQLLSLALRDSGRYFESGFDGLELLERIRALRPQTPVVVMTVDSTAEKIVSAIRDQAFSWFRKPFTTYDVCNMVDSALAGPMPADDIEVISASPRWLELRLRCDMEIATRALHFVSEMEPGLPEE